MKKVMIAGLATADDTYEDYRESFRRLEAEPFLSLAERDLEAADALVLPGSSQDMNPKLWGEEDQCSNNINDELDAVQWRLLEIASEHRIPVLGICRGMQFINVFFGGTLIQDLPCGQRHKAADPENCHPICNRVGGFMWDLYGGLCEVNTRHHQGVGRIGESLEAASFWIGEDGYEVVEAVAHRSLPVIGVQWHPERMFIRGEGRLQEDGEKLLRWFLQEKRD